MTKKINKSHFSKQLEYCFGFVDKNVGDIKVST